MLDYGLLIQPRQLDSRAVGSHAGSPPSDALIGKVLPDSLP